MTDTKNILNNFIWGAIVLLSGFVNLPAYLRYEYGVVLLIISMLLMFLVFRNINISSVTET